MLLFARGVRAQATLVTTALFYMAAFGAPVTAASMGVEVACASDYFAYCGKHDPDSSAGRACMSTHGNRLSQRCVNALVKAGEVTKAEVDRRGGRQR